MHLGFVGQSCCEGKHACAGLAQLLRARFHIGLRTGADRERRAVLCQFSGACPTCPSWLTPVTRATFPSSVAGMFVPPLAACHRRKRRDRIDFCLECLRLLGFPSNSYPLFSMRRGSFRLQISESLSPIKT